MTEKNRGNLKYSLFQVVFLAFGVMLLVLSESKISIAMSGIIIGSNLMAIFKDVLEWTYAK